MGASPGAGEAAWLEPSVVCRPRRVRNGVRDGGVRASREESCEVGVVEDASSEEGKLEEVGSMEGSRLSSTHGEGEAESGDRKPFHEGFGGGWEDLLQGGALVPRVGSPLQFP